ncbi:MAG: hypothetical protein CL935_05875 [Deltaproteobacteria bacterium]|nr:hypothetical protein [Deltaproteobacteria bacterium]
MYLLLPKIYKGKSKLICIWLLWLVITTMYLSKISASDSARVIISPISVLGKIPIPEQQILFNRFREQINHHYTLVSYRVLEMIADQEESIDIENCKSSNCVSKVKNFIDRIRWQFKTDDLFLFGLVKSEKETQLTLKLSSLTTPEVTQLIVTRNCHDCDVSTLIDEVDSLVQSMLQKIVEQKYIYPKEKIASPRDIVPRKTEEKMEEKVASPRATKPKTAEKKLEQRLEPSPPDPYTVARDGYNQQIGKLLVNVTYSLQVFRSGMFVKLQVSIDQEGNVVNHKIIKSSGSQDFDQTAILNVKEIKFDPLPDVMKKFGNYIVILQIQNSR